MFVKKFNESNSYCAAARKAQADVYVWIRDGGASFDVSPGIFDSHVKYIRRRVNVCDHIYDPIKMVYCLDPIEGDWFEHKVEVVFDNVADAVAFRLKFCE